MSEPQVDPFDRTKIIPGVPELPAESTLVLPINQPLPADPVAPGKKRISKPWIGGAAALLLLAGGAGWWLTRTETVASHPEPVADRVPLRLQGYVDAAKLGDVKAMRMLGASYTYGLGVRVNKAEGRAWYRKAAEAGDKMAAQELKAISPGDPANH